MAKGRKQLEYKMLEEANPLIERIITTFKRDIFFNIESSEVVAICITNEKPDNLKWIARIKPISGSFKLLLQNINGKKPRFIIEIYEEVWNNLSEISREWVFFHELLHIFHSTSSKMFQHDVRDFSSVIRHIGVFGYNKTEKSLFDSGISINSDGFLLDRKYLIEKFLEKQETKEHRK